MKKKITVLLATCILLVLSLAACGSSAPEPTTDGKASYDDKDIEILGAEFTDEYTGYSEQPISAIMVRMHFKNNSADPNYPLSSFGIRAFQDGTELEYVSVNDYDHPEAKNATKEVKDGAEYDVMMAFATISDSPVEVRITTPTASETPLTIMTFEK